MIDVAHDDWAKMDARLDSNPKIRKAGRNGRDVFLFLLRRNRLLSGGGADGRIPVSNIEHWYLADQLMMTEADAAEGVTRAVAAGLIFITADFVTISGFTDDWGGRSPLTEAERKRAQRAREREMQDESGPTENRDDVTQCHDARDGVRTVTEKRGEERRREEIAEPRSARPRTTKVLMPADWAPSAKHAELASGLGVDMPAETIKFADYAQSNAKRYADWDAAFRTWLRNAAEFAKRRQGGPAGVIPIRPMNILNRKPGA